MKFIIETKPVYIKTDTSWIGMGAALIQTRSVSSCSIDEALDNSIFDT